MFSRQTIPHLLLFCLLLIVGCATVSSPQGGPKDSLPPLVVDSKPLPRTTNFDGKEIQITLSEFIQLKDQSKLFFTSPQMKQKPALTVRGKTIVVEFVDSLLADQTYRLDFGSSIVDNNEGNALNDYTFTFSTGDYIDSLVMVGQTLDAHSRDTIVGAFITYFGVEQDSTYLERGLDSTLQKSAAQGLFRSDSSGYYVADILKGNPYRIYAFLDNNGNQLYEAGTDFVAFTNKTYNPLELPGFSFGYDSLRKRMFIDSLQIVFDLFQEESFKRQNLTASSRPNSAQMLFEFNAPEAQIDSLIFDSIPSDWLIEERSANGDSIYYWIATPTKEQYESLPDTLLGRVVYAKHDSTMQLSPFSDDITMVYTPPQVEVSEEEQRAAERAAREEQREARREERNESKQSGDKTEVQDSLDNESVIEPKDSLKMADSTYMGVDTIFTSDSLSPTGRMSTDTLGVDSLYTTEGVMPIDSLTTDSLPAQKVEEAKLGFKVYASSEFNPENNLVMIFDYPLKKIDSTQIFLTETIEEKQRGRRGGDAEVTETKHDVPIHIVQKGLREVIISAEWKFGGKYSLTIADSVFENIIWQANDSLSSDFTVLDPDEFATIIVKAEQDSLADSTLSYIIEIITINPEKTTRGAEENPTSSTSVVKRITDAKPGGSYYFRFLDPELYAIRIIEDRNGDGEWTTGDLTERIQPERSKIHSSPSGRPKLIEGKEKWEIEEIVRLGFD